MTKKVEPKMKHRYNISGMTCRGCVEKIKTALESIDQITRVEINLEDSSAIISMGDHVQTDVFQKAISKLGDYEIKMDMGDMMNTVGKKVNLWKDLLPLFVIFGFILVFSIIITFYFNEGFMFGMRMFMGGFFVIFGFLKLIKLSDFAIAYADYDLIAARSKTYAVIYPFIELGLGAAYFFNFMLPITNIVTLMVMSVGALGVFLKLKKGEKIQCACLGTVFKVPMTWVTLAEDLLMVLMAAIMIINK